MLYYKNCVTHEFLSRFFPFGIKQYFIRTSMYTKELS